MDRRAIYAILVVAAAGGAYWFYTRKNSNSTAQTAPQDQTPAMAAEQYYTQPPNISAQSYSSGGQVFTQGQAQPLPYNG